MFNKLIKLIHVNVSKNLRSQIADWYTSPCKKIRPACNKAINNLSQKFHYFFVFDSLFKYSNKNIVIHGIKEFSDIALQGIAFSCIIFTYRANHLGNFSHPLVRSFAHATGERIRNKGRVKYGIQHFENCMVQNAVSDSSFVNPPNLWVMNPKPIIRSVFVISILQIPVKVKDVLFQIKLKINDIKFVFLVGLENIPCTEQSSGRNY